MQQLLHSPRLHILTAGILLGVPFVTPWLWWTIFFGVALTITIILDSTTWPKAVGAGVVIMTIKSLFAIGWFWSVYPIEWLGISLGEAQLFLIGVLWMSCALFIGLGGAVLSLLRYVPRSFLFLIGAPLLWVLSEIVGSFTFSLFTTTGQVALSSGFSFGYIGYALASHGVLRFAALLGGVYALTFLTVFLVCLVQKMYTVLPKQYRYLGLGLIFLLAVVTMPYSPYTHEVTSSTVSVAVIDTKFGGDVLNRTDRLEYKQTVLREAVKSALSYETKYVVLPEDSGLLPSGVSPSAMVSMLSFLYGKNDVTIIDSGTVVLPSGKAAVRASVIDGKTNTLYQADKQYLVPQGEFMPIYTSFLLKAFGQSAVSTAISDRFNFAAGPLVTQEHFAQDIPAVLFCFESVDPLGVARLLRDRTVPFVAHPLSHAWFHAPYTLRQQLDTMLMVQAIFNRVYIVSAGNNHDGALYTPQGKKQYPVPVAQGIGWKVGIIEW